MKYQLEPAFKTNISHEGFLCTMADGGEEIVVIRFSGKAGYGTEGNFDAGYIISIIQTILSGCLPKAVVVDFSQVTYEFGNGMMKALDLKNQYGATYFPDDFPHAVVISKPSNILYKLISAIGFCRNEFQDLDEAIEYVERTFLAKPADKPTHSSPDRAQSK